MTVTSLSIQELGRDIAQAMKAAEEGPVFITEDGKPVHVLLTINMYHQIKEGPKNVAELLAIPEGEDIEFEPPRLDFTPNPPNL